MSESEILERLDLDMGVRKGFGVTPLEFDMLQKLHYLRKGN